MRLTERGASIADLQSAIDSAGRVIGRESLGNIEVKGVLPNLTLRAKDSRGKMARRAASGRRGNGASWEAHRIFLDVFFTLRPQARVKTSLTTYKGAADYVSRYRSTANQGVN